MSKSAQAALRGQPGVASEIAQERAEELRHFTHGRRQVPRLTDPRALLALTPCLGLVPSEGIDHQLMPVLQEALELDVMVGFVGTGKCSAIAKSFNATFL